LQPQQTTSTPELVVGRAGVVGVGVEQLLNTSPAFSSAEDTQPPPFTPHTELILNSSSCTHTLAVTERINHGQNMERTTYVVESMQPEPGVLDEPDSAKPAAAE
jgi:hypothetical protein